MRVFVAVNRISEIGFRQTTALLIASLIQKGHQVALAEVSDFQFADHSNDPRFQAYAQDLDKNAPSFGTERDSKWVQQFTQTVSDRSLFEIATDDVILIRTNPGRDQKRTPIHQSFVHFCSAAKLAGIRVFNNPFAVSFFSSKSAIAVIDPCFRPEMIVSEDHQQIVKFIRNSNRDCVVKPLVGSRGNDVLKLHRDQEGLNQILNQTFAGRSVVIQHFIPSDKPGDNRVIVLDGKILEENGHVAGISRTPAAGDFRANLHAGGTAHRLTLTPEQHKAATHAARILNAHGIRLAGVDLVGAKIIELNVFSTGGLFDCQRFTGIDFANRIIEALIEQRIS